MVDVMVGVAVGVATLFLVVVGEVVTLGAEVVAVVVTLVAEVVDVGTLVAEVVDVGVAGTLVVVVDVGVVAAEAEARWCHQLPAHHCLLPVLLLRSQLASA